MDEEKKYNSGLKSENFGKSKYSSQKDSKEAFQKAAELKFEDEQELKSHIFKLSNQFMSFIKDKTLLENKSPIQTDLEADIPRQIVELGLKLDNDETKAEGIGSAGSIMLILRCLLTQRNNINELGFKVENLEKEIHSLKKLLSKTSE